MNFRFNHSNAEKISYLVLYASKETPNEQYVLLNGEEVDVTAKESVEVSGLECSKEYKLVVAAEGVGQTMLVEKAFQTEDDPDQVIQHNYTRARGTKYGSSYFMMFSYEDANEADNFAYNEKTLSLDC
jgi:GH25 family lysozyme M1 (1,4-beta-N-acetylmuramidase)